MLLITSPKATAAVEMDTRDDLPEVIEIAGPRRSVITARQAFEADRTRYFTGKPCKRGHLAERMLSNGCCVECLNERRAYHRAWKKANPEKRAAYDKAYSKRHPETRKRATAKYRTSHADLIRERDREAHARMRRVNPEAEKARTARWNAKQEAIKTAIAGRARPAVCDVCGEFNRQIVFDHCHATGGFRGWLCDRCNKVLGIVRDSPELLLALRDYLKGAVYGKADEEATEKSA
jgi:hypothetical protein